MTANRIGNAIEKGYEYGVVMPLNGLNEVVQKTDGMEKTCKLIISIIDGLQSIFSHFGRATALAATVVLRGKLKIVADIISGLNFIERVTEIVCPEKGKKVPFWCVGGVIDILTNAKNISRAFLTAAHFIDFMKLLDSFELISLGRIASETLGRVPIINLVKDGCVLVSSVFSIVNNVQSLKTAWKQNDKIDDKLNRWKETAATFNRQGQAAGAQQQALNQAANRNVERRLAQHCEERHQHFQGLVAQKRAELQEVQARLAQLEEGNNAQLIVKQAKLQREIANFSGKANKWQRQFVRHGDNHTLVGGLNGYLNGKIGRFVARAQNKFDDKQAAAAALELQIQAGGKQQQPIAERMRLEQQFAAAQVEMRQARAELEDVKALRGHGQLGRFADHRVEVLQVDASNSLKKVLKPILAATYDIAKIAIIIFGTLSLMLGLATFGWTMALFSVALVVNGLGVFKFLAEELYFNKVAERPALVVPGQA